MKGRNVLMVAGWAHASDDLSALADLLSVSCTVRTTSPAELFAAPAEDPEPASAAGVSPGAKALYAMTAGGDGPWSLIGWSLGAILALEAAIHLPLNLHRMAVIGGTARFCAGDEYRWGVPEASLRGMSAGLRKDPEQTLGAFFREAMAPYPVDPEAIALKTRNALAWGLPSLSRGLEYLRQTDLRGSLARISAAVLVIHGAQDKIVPLDAGRFLSRNLPHGRLQIRPDAGHCEVLQDPRPLAKSILSFLGGDS